MVVRGPARRRVALTVLVVISLGVAMLGGALWAAQRRMIYFPDRGPVPAAGTVGARDVVLGTSDGLRLGAWLVEPPAGAGDVAGDLRGTAVLVAPGNGGNRLGRLPLARALSAAGLTVLLLDYRGYGGNPGTPGAAGLARDVRAARRYLVERAGIRPGRLIYFGESLGGAVVTELATAHPPSCLVLRSPFTDLAAVGRHHYPVLPVGLLLRDRYPVAELIGEVTVPTVVICGTADSIVPPEHSREVAARAGGPTRLVEVPGADHNDAVLSHGAPVVEAVTRLAARVAG